MKKTLITLGLSSLLMQVGQAATVSSLADAGPGSLRDAIAAAAPGETITFAVSGTIALTSGELLINKSLIISGPGYQNLNILRDNVVGAPDFRIFNIDSGIVSISGVTVSGGRAPVGGGIHNEATLTLFDCFIGYNSALSAGAGLNNLSTVTISNCVLVYNIVTPPTGSPPTTGQQNGGGINNQGTLTAIACNIYWNSVLGGLTNAARGGGIYNNGTLSVTNSSVGENDATGGGAIVGSLGAEGSGGGLFNEGTAALNTTAFISNAARGGDGGPGKGGGIGNRLGTLILDRCTVSQGIAGGTGAGGDSLGGGIASELGTVIVESSTISRNAVAASRFARNGGGGIFNTFGSLSLQHSTITANSVPTNSLQGGAGLWNSEGILDVKNTIMAGNNGVFDILNDPSGDIRSGGFNLFGTTNSPFVAGPNDHFDLTAAEIRLGPLQDNGGPTFTHALLCGSPAINAGDNTGAPPTDQRGFPRIVDGIIDIGSFELSNSPPLINCGSAATICSPSNTAFVNLSVNVSDANGDALTVIWSVDGTPIQTNDVPAGGPPTTAAVDLVAILSAGPHQITVAVHDPSGCIAACKKAVTVVPRGDLYPIALSQQTLAGVPVGGTLADIYNGVQPGNFGWLTWAGSPSEPTLVKSLTPPGNSSTYVNPNNRLDHTVSVGDWVRGKPGISNGSQVRAALNTLKTIDITVPVWDQAVKKGNNSLYHVVGFARVRLLNYQLPNQNRITARFLGLVPCD